MFLGKVKDNVIFRALNQMAIQHSLTIFQMHFVVEELVAIFEAFNHDKHSRTKNGDRLKNPVTVEAIDFE